MCIGEKDFNAFRDKVYEDVGSVKNDVSSIRDCMVGVEKYLGELKDRTKDLEHRVGNIEDDKIRLARCPQTETIDLLTENMLTASVLREHMQQQEKKQVQQQAHRDNKIKWVVGLVGAGIGLITVLVNVVLHFV